MANVLDRLRNGLVVSCQPVDDGPMDKPSITAAMAQAAIAGGAAGVRIEGVANLAATRAATDAPIIGLVKHDLTDSPIRITPFLTDVAALAMAGADVIAYDATDRKRPVETAQIVQAIKAAGCLAMADCASLADGVRALREGADILGSTLSGYAYNLAASDAGPDLELVGQFRKLGAFVMAEGRLNSPAAAKSAIVAGADCITVGSAITRIEIITGWFAQATTQGTLATGIAVDFGGTKVAAARLVRGEVIDQTRVDTAGHDGPEAQINTICDLLEQLKVKPDDKIGVAVTGRVTKRGEWHALNTDILPGITTVPLCEILSKRFGRDVTILNDATAAAIGEHVAGAGQGQTSLGFITVSTGIGGGFVLDGKPLVSSSGLASHVGFTTSRIARDMCGSGRLHTVESVASGRAIARMAAEMGHANLDAKAVYEAHLTGEAWASGLIRQSANAVAELCANLKATLDLDLILIGGGIGLAQGYLAMVKQALQAEPEVFHVALKPASLGVRAAYIGVLSG